MEWKLNKNWHAPENLRSAALELWCKHYFPSSVTKRRRAQVNDNPQTINIKSHTGHHLYLNFIPQSEHLISWVYPR